MRNKNYKSLAGSEEEIRYGCLLMLDVALK
jgi:hypothetical protein